MVPYGTIMVPMMVPYYLHLFHTDGTTKPANDSDGRSRWRVPPSVQSRLIVRNGGSPSPSTVLAKALHPKDIGLLARWQQDFQVLLKCYQRVAVGKRLNSTEVSSNQALATVRQCEQECERSTCYAFAFGQNWKD
ncbi:unnamed protein product [Nesidiocoris tenuis]|uniref:Apple domain-containing protein n=1 Tax=Nesidiocoris tenuis TaxID=355587 RepID=A0A6H5H4X0_9HEMI|nr:unnamed protein product [Nesidiocoris tenuis]